MVSRHNLHFVQSKHIWHLDVNFVFWNEKMICISMMHMTLYLSLIGYENSLYTVMNALICWGKLAWKDLAYFVVEQHSFDKLYTLSLLIMTCAWLDMLWIWFCLCKGKSIDMLLGWHSFADKLWLSTRLDGYALFFSALLISGFINSSLCIMKLGWPLGSWLILDIY